MHTLFKTQLRHIFFVLALAHPMAATSQTKAKDAYTTQVNTPHHTPKVIAGILVTGTLLCLWYITQHPSKPSPDTTNNNNAIQSPNQPNATGQPNTNVAILSNAITYCQTCKPDITFSTPTIFHAQGEEAKQEGYWKTKKNDPPTAPEGCYPFPTSHPQPFQGAHTFIQILAAIEAYAMDKTDTTTDTIPLTQGELSVLSFRGLSCCRLCPPDTYNGSHTFQYHPDPQDASENTTIEWPEGYRHYLRKHHVRPSKEFYDLMLGIAQQNTASLSPYYKPPST